MSNFSGIGTSMLKNYLVADNYVENEPSRDLRNQKADLQSSVIDYEMEAAGGETAYAKELSEREALKRENAQLKHDQEILNLKAKRTKINAQAAKAASKGAATLTNSGYKKVNKKSASGGWK